MRNPFKRHLRSVPPQAMHVSVMTFPDITVKHTIERKPQPVPTTIQFIFRRPDGFLFQGIPSPLYGDRTMMYPFPLQWLTGRVEDNEQVEVQCVLSYER
jgi:hypothetical protein